jgi:PAS domain S-box-containing protein
MRVLAVGSLVVLITLGIFLVQPAPVADVNAKVSDFVAGWAGPGKPSGNVAIVEIDEKSLAQFGRWPWPRDLIGHLVRNILNRGPAVLAVDMMFPQEDPGHDSVLADALAGKPVVIGHTLRFDRAGADSRCPVPSMPLALVGEAGSRGDPFFHATGAVCSVAEISRAAAGGGFLNAAPDPDGILRRVPVLIEYGNRYDPSLALAALDLYRHVSHRQLFASSLGAERLRLDNRTIPLEGPSTLRLRFRGARRTFPYVSAADILADTGPQDALRGKIAILGGTAAGIESPIVTPVDPLFPDVEVQATVMDNLLQGDSLWRSGGVLLGELMLGLLAGLTSIFLLERIHFLRGVLISLGLIAGVWAVSALAVKVSGVILSPLPASAAIAVMLPVLTVVNYRRQKSTVDRTRRQLVAASEMQKESESRYRRLVENINDAIAVDDVEGRLLFANRRFREWFGLVDREIRDVHLEDFVAPECLAEVRDRHDRRVRGEVVPDHFEFVGIRSDGTRICIEALVTTVEEDGRIVGTQAALRDVTERKRMEAEYQQAQKMESIGRLAGGVAHDFNNLLTVINGYSGMLLDELPAGDRSRRSLEQILKAGEHAAELTQKLLAFSRKQLVKPRQLSLNLVVTEAEKMLDRVIGEDIDLVTRLSPDLALVVADPGQMHQVVMNLVVNARDAMPNGGQVIVETKNAEHEVCLGVTDTGTGMSEEVLAHLFEPFFTTKEPGKGTGLGLATIYGIVHQSGGRIEVKSKVGKGTTFLVYLARVESATPEGSDSPAPVTSLRGWETILVVEDQEAVRQMTVAILESYGYLVLQAPNGPEALAMAEKYSAPIHLLLTDIVLPLMDGRVLADKLRAVRPDTKMLYVSGYSEEKIGRRSPFEGDKAYLAKPFTSTALAARVREILAEGEIRGNAKPR